MGILSIPMGGNKNLTGANNGTGKRRSFIASGALSIFSGFLRIDGVGELPFVPYFIQSNFGAMYPARIMNPI